MALLYITKIFPQRQQFSKYHPQKQKLQLGKQFQHNANRVDSAYSSPHPESSSSLDLALFTAQCSPLLRKVAMMMLHRNNECPGPIENTEKRPWQCPVDLLSK